MPPQHGSEPACPHNQNAKTVRLKWERIQSRELWRLGHTKLESTVRYLGVDAEDALTLSEGTEV